MNIHKVNSEKDKIILHNLVQLYLYDFSEFSNKDVNEMGEFDELSPFLHSYYESQEENAAYLFSIDTKWVGFALIRKKQVQNTYIFQELFILKKYRKLGIGQKAVLHILKLFGGEWQVYQLQENEGSQKFWIKVLDQYTKGDFIDYFESGRRYQTFRTVPNKQ